MATRKSTTRRTRKSSKEKKPVEVKEEKPTEEPQPKEDARPPLGEGGPSRGRKLDATKVRDIRARLAKGEKAADIAAVYGLHSSSVDDIRVGRTWKSVV